MNRRSRTRASVDALRTHGSDGARVSEEERLIAPKPTPNAAQLVLVGLTGETRRTVGLGVARTLGRPFADSRLLPGQPAGADPADTEIAAIHRALGGTTRIVLACSVRLFDAELGAGLGAGLGSAPGSAPDDQGIDDARTVDEREIAERLASVWVVWIDHRSAGGDGAGNGIEVEHPTDEAQRRRAERWADTRIDASELSHDQLIDSILDAWTACPGR